MKSRRVSWAARALSAQRRFNLYCQAVNRIETEKAQGGTPKTMAWRLPENEIAKIIRRGGETLRAFGHKQRSRVPHAQIERLEEVLAELSDADDWIRRLKTFWDPLDPAAKNAFERLVNRGCVPDLIVYCLEQQRGSPSRANRKQTQHLDRRRRLRALSEAFKRLANRCDEYLELPSLQTVENYQLSPRIPVLLKERGVEGS